jgi:hypothetical protein
MTRLHPANRMRTDLPDCKRVLPKEEHNEKI